MNGHVPEDPATARLLFELIAVLEEALVLSTPFTPKVYANSALMEAIGIDGYPHWVAYGPEDVFDRGHVYQTGLPESGVAISRYRIEITPKTGGAVVEVFFVGNPDPICDLFIAFSKSFQTLIERLDFYGIKLK